MPASSKLAWPYPEFLHPGPWRVLPSIDSKAFCNLHERILQVPLSLHPTERFIRAHELVHSAITPPNLSQIVKAHPLSALFLYYIEELRVNETVLRLTNLRISPEPTKWTSSFDSIPLAPIPLLQDALGTWGRADEHVRVLARANEAPFGSLISQAVLTVYRYIYKDPALPLPPFQRVFTCALVLGNLFLSELNNELANNNPLSVFDETPSTPSTSPEDALNDLISVLSPPEPDDNDEENSPNEDDPNHSPSGPPDPELSPAPHSDPSSREERTSEESASSNLSAPAGTPDDNLRTSPKKQFLKAFRPNPPPNPTHKPPKVARLRPESIHNLGALITKYSRTPGKGKRPDGRDTKEHKWRPIRVVTHPLRAPAVDPKLLGRRKRRFQEEGVVPTRLSRECIDGAVFEHKKRGRHAALLFDCSGSMRLSSETIKAFLRAAPASVIGLYSGSRDDGVLHIVANKGKRLADADHKNLYHLGSNYYDLPALQWLAKQRGPRIWVSDGGVHAYAKDNQRRNPAVISQAVGLDCLLQCLQANITQYLTPNAALLAFHENTVVADRGRYKLSGLNASDFEAFGVKPL